MSMQALQLPQQALAFLRQRVTGRLQIDSRKIAPGDGFIAWPGAATDGRSHVADALARGAAACLVEAEGVQAFGFTDARIASLPGLKTNTAMLAADWFGHPSEQLQVLAVTGTNGKTSSACWLADALNFLSKQERSALAGCALVGTLGMGVPPQLEATGMTTPDPVLLQAALRRFADQGLGFCAMEASSIGIEEQRLAGLHIRAALLTNFTQDHLDYHASMDAYWQAKRRLFDWPGLRTVVLNIDDPKGAQLHAELAQRPQLDLWTYSLHQSARLQASDIALGAAGLRFVVQEGGQQLPLQTQVIGQYNVSNLLGVIATLRSLGVTLEQALAACAQLRPVPGRMQQIVQAGQPLVAVDYAHTPDALVQALAALRPLAQERAGQLWCVFGCGGNRDATKRPLMGAAAQQGADRVIVTSDNPRHELAQTIIEDIERGMQPGYTSQADRARAIAQAIAQAGAQDVVLIAGKGHEDYQEIAGVKHAFSDMQQAEQALLERRTSTTSTTSRAGGSAT